MRHKVCLILIIILIVSMSFSTVFAATASVILDGKEMQFDVPPTIEEGRTLVPMRAIFEALGADVQWQEATRTVIATQNETEIKLQIGQKLAYRNGNPVNLDVPAKIINGRTMVPLRFISESLGSEVGWDGTSRVVTIVSRATFTDIDKDIIPSIPETDILDEMATIPWEGSKDTDLNLDFDLNLDNIPDLSKAYNHTSDEMKKAIETKRQENPWIGKAIGEIKLIAGGMHLACEGGHIYFGDEVGRAHIVLGSIYNKWMAKEGPNGFLKFPTTDELVVPDQVGRYSHFEGGSIYFHPAIGAYEVHGLIRNKWQSMGWEKSQLGYPISDEMTLADGIGRYSAFQGGRIYYHPDHGTHFVTGNIYLRWMGNSKNNETGALGYPKSDTLKSSSSFLLGEEQLFEKGKIVKFANDNPGMDLRGEINRREIDIRNQGKRDTCSVHTMNFLLEYGYSQKFGDKYRQLSVEYLNHVANKAAGKTDDGDYFSSIADGYNTYGIIRESEWKYDKDWTYDYDEAEKILTPQMLAAGKVMIGSGWKLNGSFVKPFERDSSLTDAEFKEILKLLDKGIPVGLGRNHSMAVVGYQYDATYDGGGYFIFRNSYGTGIGEKGYQKESFQKVKSLTNDVYVYQ